MDIQKVVQEKGVAELKQQLMILDSKFDFRCQRCGKCCRSLHSVLLTPRDVYNIAKALGKTVVEVINGYAEVSIGQDSLLPMVLLVPVGKEKACPFLKDGRCSIYEQRPTACALYPLRRVVFTATPGEPISSIEDMEVRYAPNDSACGHTGQYDTIQSWLRQVNVQEHDSCFLTWILVLIELAELIHDIKDVAPQHELLRKLPMMAYTILYTQYDAALDFEPQFSKAVKELRRTCQLGKADLDNSTQLIASS